MECGISVDNLRNLLITISYNGKNYHGWQIQNNAITVQEVLQTALSNVVGEFYDLKGCSRTDSGVHADMYCLSVKIKHKIPDERLKCALNRWLPLDVVCLSVCQVDKDFHARYNCKSKRYVYKVWNCQERNPFLDGLALHFRYNIDEKLLNEVAQDFVGKQDFKSFCTLDNREITDFTRDVKMFSVEREGKMVLFTVEADGFLYNMVRIMVGTLLDISQNKIDRNAIKTIISQRDRTYAGITASPCGLYLSKVNY